MRRIVLLTPYESAPRKEETMVDNNSIGIKVNYLLTKILWRYRNKVWRTKHAVMDEAEH